MKKKRIYVSEYLVVTEEVKKGMQVDYLIIPSKKGEYGPVEDMQLIINHILAHWYQITLK